MLDKTNQDLMASMTKGLSPKLRQKDDEEEHNRKRRKRGWLAAGPKAGGGGSSLNWVQRADGVLANIDLDFVNNKAYVNGQSRPPSSFLNVLRASSALADDSLGNWISFPAGNGLAGSGSAARITNKGLLTEEQRANLVLWSSDLVNGSAFWNNLLHVATATPTAAPDGTGPAYKVQDSDTTNNQHFALANSSGGTFTAGSPVTYSAFFKPAEYSTVSIAVRDPTFTNGFGVGATLTGAGSVQGGTVFGTGTFTSATIVAYPNGWFRVSVTGVVSPTDTQGRVAFYLNTNSFSSYVGVIGNGLYHWNSQLESGTFPTSPMVTTGSTFTRAGDVVWMPAAFSTTALSLYSDTTLLGYLSGTFPCFIDAGPQPTTNNDLAGMSISSLTVLTQSFTGGTPTGAGTSNAVVVNNPFEAAASFTVGGQMFGMLNAGPPASTPLSALSALNNTLGIGRPDRGGGCFRTRRATAWTSYGMSLSAMRNLTSTPNILMAPDNSGNTVQATTDLNFVTDVGFNQGATGPSTSFLSNTRNSSAYMDDLAGNWVLFPPLSVRRSNKGLLAEEQRIQQVPGASNFTVGGWSAQPANVTAGSGISTDLPQLFPGAAIWKAVYSGSGDNNCGAVNLVGSIVNATNYTVSCWLYIKGGTGVGVPQVTVEGGGSFPVFTANANGSLLNQWQKVTATVTSTGTGLPAIVFRVPGSSGATVYHTAPQFEQGGVPTSFIGNTTTGTATRPGDVITLNQVPPFGSNLNTIFTQAITSTKSPAVAIAVSDGSANNRLALHLFTGTPFYHGITTSGGVGTDQNTGSIVTGIRAKWAVAVQTGANGQALVANGGSPVNGSPTYTAGGTFNQVLIGTSPDNFPYDGYIERIAIWSTSRISNAGLQSLTT